MGEGGKKEDSHEPLSPHQIMTAEKMSQCYETLKLLVTGKVSLPT